MSLIQDALKRKTEESPAVRPPGIPVEILEPPAESKGPKAPLLLLLILLLAAFLAAPLVVYSIYQTKPKPRALLSVIKKPAPVAPVAVAPVVAAPVVAVPVAIPKPPVQAAKTAVVATVVAPVKKEEPAPEAKPAWPELKLTGVAQGKSQSLAILNGKMLPTGRTLGEVTIIEVNDSSIVVEYQGERRVLHLDE